MHRAYYEDLHKRDQLLIDIKVASQSKNFTEEGIKTQKSFWSLSEKLSELRKEAQAYDKEHGEGSFINTMCAKYEIPIELARSGGVMARRNL